MIDVNNESGVDVDSQRLVRLATFVLRQMRIHVQSDLAILLVDETTMAGYNERFMGHQGPTDVLSFPMDELRVPNPDEPAPRGLLGDIVLCPAVTAAQAADERALAQRRVRLPAGARNPAPARLRPRRTS